jgi:lysophospholipase
VVCPGRIESYVKYAELAYDLSTGFDVMIIDHRGQGRSGRMLSDTHRGHVVNFSDYVDDLAAFWQQEVQPGPGESGLSLRTHGRAIATLFLQRYHQHCDAIALCAPMFGIVMRLPDWMVRHILDWAEGHQRIREEYAIGTGRWRALPFAVNVLTHSRSAIAATCAFMPMNRSCASAGRPGTGCARDPGR